MSPLRPLSPAAGAAERLRVPPPTPTFGYGALAASGNQSEDEENAAAAARLSAKLAVWEEARERLSRSRDRAEDVAQRRASRSPGRSAYSDG